MPNLEIDGFEAYYIDSRKPLREGTKIKLCGKSVLGEPALHLPKTKYIEARYPYVDFDGDGLVDGTNVPYDAEFVKNSNKFHDGLRCGSYANVNPITPPSEIKLVNIKDGIKFSIPKTSVAEDCEGGFFGKTRFVLENQTLIGTDHDDNELLVFDIFDEYKIMT
jgi:hypothetical protein